MALFQHSMTLTPEVKCRMASNCVDLSEYLLRQMTVCRGAEEAMLVERVVTLKRAHCLDVHNERFRENLSCYNHRLP